MIYFTFILLFISHMFSFSYFFLLFLFLFFYFPFCTNLFSISRTYFYIFCTYFHALTKTVYAPYIIYIFLFRYLFITPISISLFLFFLSYTNVTCLLQLPTLSLNLLHTFTLLKTQKTRQTKTKLQTDLHNPRFIFVLIFSFHCFA